MTDQHKISPQKKMQSTLATAMRAVAALNTAHDQRAMRQKLLAIAAELEGAE